ncbi:MULTISPECIES: uroporphyrinogen-III C-methyltransferase [unclassified Polaromonas]|uniref:uroporphyrinogen-III C-methyltransferase n=1 Tax=unclassified Polaromonas TaxID=2638319 RepID=UPI0018CBE1F7|nr:MULTISPECIES: uroporphyrinogen-III C-methyltransferase [unclassified Polaromonas]MBG6070510.1 uroporphyrin-3 C-methyltransferase [Polaromonas sp. CG_9.7]MBG6112508.1 uroporphyrin-3 C-methyltransferase [Polaromonas sp. CG_9.2]
MSDSPPALPPLNHPPPAGEPVPERGVPSAAPALDAWLVPRSWALGVAALAAAGLLGSASLWQKLGSIQEELARRTTDTSAQSIEARTLAQDAQDSTKAQAVRLALLETRLSEVSLQRSQIEELMQSLSRSRDENLVVDVESDLRLAQQRALLTGSAEPLLAALKSAETRLTRAAQPRLNPLQRAVTRDIERVKSANIADVPALMLKLDELARLVDELPVVNEVANNSIPRPVEVVAAKPIGDPPDAGKTSWLPGVDTLALRAWSSRVAGSLWLEASQLLRVSRIDQPEAALLAPEQAFFLRENLKLRLLNARLALLSRQTDAARADLINAGNWLGKYFDPSARKTQAARQLLVQVQGQLKNTDLPRLDETLAALATAAAGR